MFNEWSYSYSIDKNQKTQRCRNALLRYTLVIRRELHLMGNVSLLTARFWLESVEQIVNVRKVSSGKCSQISRFTLNGIVTVSQFPPENHPHSSSKRKESRLGGETSIGGVVVQLDVIAGIHFQFSLILQ